MLLNLSLHHVFELLIPLFGFGGLSAFSPNWISSPSSMNPQTHPRAEGQLQWALSRRPMRLDQSHTLISRIKPLATLSIFLFFLIFSCFFSLHFHNITLFFYHFHANCFVIMFRNNKGWLILIVYMIRFRINMSIF